MDKIGVKPIGNIILSGNKKYVLVQNEAEFLVPIDNFDEIIMKNIFEEASKLLIALGAKEQLQVLNLQMFLVEMLM